MGPVRSGRNGRAAASPAPGDQGEVGMAATRSPSRRARTPPAALRADAADGAAEAAMAPADGAACADTGPWTFVQCENVDCMKWRKVRVQALDSTGAWVCAMNPDRRCAPAAVRRPLTRGLALRSRGRPVYGTAAQPLLHSRPSPSKQPG